MTDPEDRDEPPRAVTLGARLDAAGRSLLERRRSSSVWSGAVEALLERVAASSRRRDRFERLESQSSRAPRHPTRPQRGPAHAPLPTGRPVARSGGGHEPSSSSSPLTASPHGAGASRPGRPLPADLRAAVRHVTGGGAEHLRVHTDGPADALARRHHADAVTVGSAVSFRSGRYRPDEPEGFGLLAHEASHVASGPAGADPRRAEDLERTARRHERVARAGGPAVADPPGRSHRPSEPRPAAPSALLAHPDRAPDRPSHHPVPVALPAAAHADRDVAAVLPQPLDVEALRRSLLDELKRQLRTDSERGA